MAAPFERVIRSLTRPVLLLYPRHTRDRFGEELLHVIVQRVRRDRAVHGSFRCVLRWLLDLADVAAAGMLERIGDLTATRAATGRGQAPLPRTQPSSKKDETTMSRFIQDVRYAIRTLAKQPVFASTLVVTVALGVGANTAMFSVVHGILLRPLPYPEGHELVRVFQSDRINDTQREGVSGPDYFDYLAQQTVFEGMAAWTGFNPTITDATSAPERVSTAQVTYTFLPTIGLTPVLGRGFLPAEDSPGGANTAIVSHGFWTRRFGADTTVLGRPIRLDGTAYMIVGILPRDFRFLTAVDMLVPLQYGPTTRSRGVHNLGVVARLRDGATIDMARSEMNRIMAALEEQYPDDNVGRGANVELLSEFVTGNVRSPLFILMGAVMLVLLIMCANVANMLLARGTTRQREMAVRAALGASRGRLALQLLAESLILACLGGALGVLVALGGLRVLLALNPTSLPRLAEVSLSAPVLAFALILTVVTGVAFGVLPALQGSQHRLHETLGEGARTSSGPGTGRVRAALVVTQVAFAFVLVVGAGLLIRSMWNLTSVDPGFQYRNLVTVSVSLPQDRYPSDFRQWPDAPEVKRFYASALAAAQRIPSVTGAAMALNHPANPGWTTRISIEGGPLTVEEGVEEERLRPISPGYFKTIGTPLTRGRDFSDFDRGESTPVVIVNEAFVRKYFPSENALGKRVQFWGTMREIVGVVADVRFMGVNAPVEPAVYAPMSQLPFSQFDIILRGDAPAEQIIQSMRSEIRQIDGELAMFGGQSFESILASALGSQRFNMIMLGMFALLALVLAAVGIYGVVSYGVSRRAHEFGVRMSLGANSGDVSRLVLTQAVRMTAAGVGLGLIGAVVGSKIITGMLYGVAPTDPATLGGVALFLSGVALCAALIPALRASRVDPVTALRLE